ncbi:DNA-binding transcription factor rap1 [Batrachochytrium dendrobatidis]|nr:DNA-binding transcription factor rap1 [Batrachochytrium dendrobatidis]
MMRRSSSRNKQRSSGIFVDDEGNPLVFTVTLGVHHKHVCAGIQDNGGVVDPEALEPFMNLVGIYHPTTNPNTFQCCYIDDCIQAGCLLPSDPYIIPTTSARIIHRVQFSEQDDRLLYEMLAKNKGKHFKGNDLYQDFAAQHPRHTWKAWRDRAVKKIIPRMSPQLEGANEDKMDARMTRSAIRRATQIRLQLNGNDPTSISATAHDHGDSHHGLLVQKAESSFKCQLPTSELKRPTIKKLRGPLSRRKHTFFEDAADSNDQNVHSLSFLCRTNDVGFNLTSKITAENYSTFAQKDEQSGRDAHRLDVTPKDNHFAAFEDVTRSPHHRHVMNMPQESQLDEGHDSSESSFEVGETSGMDRLEHSDDSESDVQDKFSSPCPVYKSTKQNAPDDSDKENVVEKRMDEMSAKAMFFSDVNALLAEAIEANYCKRDVMRALMMSSGLIEHARRLLSVQFNISLLEETTRQWIFTSKDDKRLFSGSAIDLERVEATKSSQSIERRVQFLSES